MIQEENQLLHNQKKTSIKRIAIKDTGIPQHKHADGSSSSVACLTFVQTCLTWSTIATWAVLGWRYSFSPSSPNYVTNTSSAPTSNWRQIMWDLLWIGKDSETASWYTSASFRTNLKSLATYWISPAGEFKMKKIRNHGCWNQHA